MDLMYANAIHDVMREGSEALCVYNLEQLLINCRTATGKYSPQVAHYYDIRALPNLSIIHAIHNELGGGVVVPSQAWKAYVGLAGIPEHNVHCLADEAVAINAPDELSGILASDNGGSSRSFYLPHSLLADISLDAQLLGRLAAARSFCIVDVNSVTTDEDEKVGTFIDALVHKHGIGCGLLHGDDLLDDVAALWLKVRIVKEIRGRTYVILSGGTNILWDASRRRSAARHKYSILTPFADSADDQECATFCGPLCTPQDTIAAEYQTEELLPGDIVVVPNTGSSGHHRSPIYFISHPAPREAMFANKCLYPLRGETDVKGSWQ